MCGPPAPRSGPGRHQLPLPPCRSTPAGAGGARPGPRRGRAERRPPGSAAARGEQAPKCRRQARRWWRRRRGRSERTTGRKRSAPRWRSELQVEAEPLPDSKAAGAPDEPRQIDPPLGRVLEREHHLEERLVGEIAVGAQLLHQPLEGEVLVRVGLQGRRRTRASSSRKVGSPERSVRSARVLTKKPISPLDLVAVAAGDRRADRQVLLPRPAREQRREGGEQDHEQGGTAAAARRAPGVDELGWQRERGARPGSSAPPAAAGRWAARARPGRRPADRASSRAGAPAPRRRASAAARRRSRRTGRAARAAARARRRTAAP